MSWFERSDNNSRAMKRYSMIAAQLHSELQNIFNTYDSKFMDMDARTKLAALASIKQKVLRLQLFSGIVSETDVPIKFAYEKILNILFRPAGASYFDILDRFVNHADNPSEIKAKENSILKQISDELSLIDAVSGTKHDIEKNLSHSMNSSIVRRGKGAAIYAALTALMVLVSVVATQNIAAQTQTNVKPKTSIVTPVYNPLNYTLKEDVAQRAIKIGNRLLELHKGKYIIPSSESSEGDVYNLAEYLVIVFDSDKDDVITAHSRDRITIHFNDRRVIMCISVDETGTYGYVYASKDMNDSRFTKITLRDYSKNPIGRAKFKPRDGDETIIWLRPLTSDEVNGMLKGAGRYMVK